MNKILALIVDDEKGSRQLLRKTIEKNLTDIEIVGEADNADEALKMITNLHPDLVFLDIEMPGKTGLDLLQELQGNIDFGIIFTTAYDHYAIEAIRYSAHDYLLKPVNKEDLIKSVNRFLQNKNKEKLSREKINTLISNMSMDARKKIAIPDQEGYIFVYLDEIIKLVSDGSYTHIYLTNHSKIVSSRPLGEYEGLLNPDVFMRVHRSYIINLDHVKRYVKGDEGYVILTDDSQVEISRRKKIEFLEKLKNF